MRTRNPWLSEGTAAFCLMFGLTACAADGASTRGVLPEEGDGVLAATTDVGAAGPGEQGTTSGPVNDGTLPPAIPGSSPTPTVGDDAAEATPEGPVPMVDVCGTGAEALVGGLRINEVAIYQAVKIPLMSDGSVVGDRTAPVVQGRDALLRAFVEIPSDWDSQSVLGTLVLDNPGMEEERLQAEVNVSRNSTDGTLSTTFNFDIPGEQLGPETGYRITLEDPSCARLGGTPGEASFPANGSEGFGAEPTGTLEVVLVPVDYAAQNTRPEVTEAQIERTKDVLGAYYPVTDVRVTVHPTGMDWSQNVSANGQGWSQLVDAVMTLRQRDRPANDVYYFALVQPGNTFQQYCGWGCVAGIAPQNENASFFGNNSGGGGTSLAQVGLGVGYMNDEFTYETMIHEIAHAHGRGHAPCGTQDADRSYPHSGGDTGVWGFDRRDRSLHPPTEKDMMGYCMPIWISDYTYNALATRVGSVSLSPYVVPGPATRWRMLHHEEDGALRWGQTHEIHGPPPGRETTVSVLNDAGEKIRDIQAYAMAIPELNDELLWVPEPQTDWKGLLTPGQWIDLGQVREAIKLELPAPITPELQLQGNDLPL